MSDCSKSSKYFKLKMAQRISLSLCVILMLALSGSGADAGSCDTLTDEIGNSQCENMVNTMNLQCSLVFKNSQDPSDTITLGEICEETCCLAEEAGAKRAEHLLFFELEDTWQRQSDDPAEDRSCDNLEDERPQCDAIVNTYKKDCADILSKNPDGSTAHTLGDVCLKSCCLAEEAQKRGEQLAFQLEALKQRQEGEESGPCDDLGNQAVGDQCDNLVNANKMDCETTIFTNPDESTSTLTEICQKTCCQAGEAGVVSDTAEKRGKQLLFNFEALKRRQEGEESGPCDDLFNQAIGDQCDNLVNVNKMDCETTIFTNPDESTSTLTEICQKTCCQAGEAGADSDTAEKRGKQLLFKDYFEGRDDK